jgi:hypothetical protein
LQTKKQSGHYHLASSQWFSATNFHTLQSVEVSCASVLRRGGFGEKGKSGFYRLLGAEHRGAKPVQQLWPQPLDSIGLMPGANERLQNTRMRPPTVRRTQRRGNLQPENQF